MRALPRIHVTLGVRATPPQMFEGALHNITHQIRILYNLDNLIPPPLKDSLAYEHDLPFHALPEVCMRRPKRYRFEAVNSLTHQLLLRAHFTNNTNATKHNF
jgi:hypothetical protein